MTAGPVNRALLESFFQQPGQIYDDTKTESSFDVIADQIDDNYAQVSTLINAGVMSPYIANAQAQAIINGNFAVNQRAKSGTVTLTAGQYGHDRWKAGSAGCTYTFATVDNVTTITITTGSLVQVIEGLNLYSGTYTLSWTGTAQGKIGAGSFGASGITAAVVGGTNLSIEFNAGTLSKVQFNVGSAPLPFQPRTFAEELEACQRYAIAYTSSAINFIIGIGTALSTTQASISVDLQKDMRVQPTLVATAGDWQVYDSVTGVDLTAISLLPGANNNQKVNLLCTVAAGLTQFRPYFLKADSTANRLLLLDSEL